MSPDPGELHIRNQRSARWSDMTGGMVIALILVGVVFQFVPALPTRVAAFLVLAGLLGLALYILYGLFRFWDLRRPVPDRPVTARTLYDWLVRGIRSRELGPADGWTVLAVFRRPAGSHYLVHHLKLGDGIEVSDPFVRARFPAQAVTRVSFAPDPQEDYVGAEHPVHFCEATIEMDSGRQFRLIATEADAQRLRQWAESKGIALRDRDGYRPRPVGSTGAA
ncbi:MAG: hypothetical protein J2P46_09870 [Zavarzinella sp.]|nr:hypothetical protein [Zavarzinella sp.]